MGDGNKGVEIWKLIKGDPNMDALALNAALGACAQAQDLTSGKEVHGVIHQKNLLVNSPHKHLLYPSLISMYAKCGSIADATAVS